VLREAADALLARAAPAPAPAAQSYA
ncbi:MAG: hypothetical protein JWR63_2197, partial [Conexibacter sp.]|nr:hypothetical protein [Conexibacter sp.]